MDTWQPVSIYPDCVALPARFVWSSQISGDNEDKPSLVKKKILCT